MFSILWIIQHIPILVVHGLLLAGIIALLAGKISAHIEILYGELLKWGGIAVVCLGLFLEGIFFTADTMMPEIAQAQAQVAAINSQAKVITKEIQIQYVDRVKVIKEKGDEVIKYVTTNNDSDCKLHNSTVELHDAAAENRIPDPATRTDEGPSGVALSEETRAVIENYNTYNQVAEQLRSLQQWVREQQFNSINNGAKQPSQPAK